MKHFIKPDQTIWAFVDGGEQDHLITPDMVEISFDDLAALLTLPPRKITQVSMRQARLALLSAGLLSQVDAAIQLLPEPAKTAALIDWEYAAVVQRSSGLVPAMGAALGMTEAEIDALFTLADTL